MWLTAMLPIKFSVLAATVRVADQVILFGYLAGAVLLGAWFARRKQSGDAATARVPGWAAGISLIGNKLSAITTMSIPAKAFTGNFLNLPYQVIQYLAAPVAAYTVVPLYRRLGITSCYQYLESRFGYPIRALAGGSYVVAMTMRLGVVLLIPSLVLSVVAGWDLGTCILVAGVAITLYTALSGLEGVIWIEVMHVLTMILGGLAALTVALTGVGNLLPELTAEAWNGGKFTVFSFDRSLSSITVWVLLLAVPAAIGPFLSEQSFVQRFVSPKDTRAAQRGLWTTLCVGVPLLLIFYLLGTALYLFYQTAPDRYNPGLKHPDELVAWFTVLEMPVGFAGLMLAAILASAASTADATINSVASVLEVDYYQRWRGNVTERAKVVFSRWVTFAVGLSGTAFGFYLSRLTQRSIFDLAIEISQIYTGCLATFFVIGLLTVRCGSTAAFAGFLGSLVAQMLVKTQTDLHFFTYGLWGLTGGLAVGYAASWLWPTPPRDLRDLTVHTLARPTPPATPTAP